MRAACLKTYPDTIRLKIRLIETFGEGILPTELVVEIRRKTADVKRRLHDSGLSSSHNRILDALKVQSEHFQIEGFEDAIQVCYRDFVGVGSLTLCIYLLTSTK